MLLGQISLLGFIIFIFLFIMSLFRKDGKALLYFILTVIFLIPFFVINSSLTKQDKRSEEDIIEEPIPDSIIYEGNGDDTIVIESPDDGPIVLDIEATPDSSRFSIDSYNENEVPFGPVIINFFSDKGTVFLPKKRTQNPPVVSHLDIKYESNWIIKSRSLRSVRAIESKSKIEGTDDDVLLIKGKFKKAKIKYENEDMPLQVDGYNSKADNSETYFYPLVDQEKGFNSTVKIDKHIDVIVIKAIGPWSIKIK